MTSKYWIKLYHEILYDRKMASLDDHLWRRAIECFLLAGDNNNNGYLPPIDDIAWSLRDDIEQIETDLNELVRIGILEVKNGGYYVKKFVERQEPMNKAEYMRRMRSDRQKDEYYQPGYQPVTNGHTESDTDKIRIDTDVDIATAVSSFHSHSPLMAERLYSRVTGQMSIPSSIRDEVIEDLISVLDYYKGIVEDATPEGKPIFQKWCNTPRKDGSGNYSPTNKGWIDWWLKELAPQPEKVKRVLVPPSAKMCEVGENLYKQIDPEKPGYMDKVTDHQAHVDKCNVCKEVSNISRVQDAISEVAERLSVR